MTREEKSNYIDALAAEISAASVFYIADTAELTVDTINAIRRRCFQTNIRLRVVKNALLEKAEDEKARKVLKPLLSSYQHNMLKCDMINEKFNFIDCRKF